jgi:outer membrane protein OmpA-like peptidoglycan-associated protein
MNEGCIRARHHQECGAGALNCVTVQPAATPVAKETDMRSLLARIARRGAAAVLMAALPLIGIAQDAAPNTQEMVEALKPRTRSLRNLIVGEAAASAPAAPASESAPPSLSMAIQFDFDSARLRPEGAAVLDRLATALQTSELKASRFLIEGHTDAKGSADYNLRLSRSRAEEVRRYLAAQGVAGQRLSAVGRGSQEPATPAAPLAAENRRVRIVTIE